ncbi:lipase family protein [Motiliproteus sp. MSK22-1]|uniref:lipase family protein n=1 Tax=Motiliproteus sp. MSK22-1 TaxID=1897630 RepID=UPI000977475E|nr:hypothetical protein [Motiliproteus sp. MSK22-1]OMH37544.1 hypothetical protein BGP75_09210 [Motiliproteus sp. MSK22-1]
MNLNEFKVSFYAAEGAYNVDVGRGNLEGYSSVSGGNWVDSATGFKATAYKDTQGNYILAFAGTEPDQDPYQDIASFGWGQWESNRDKVFTLFRRFIEDLDPTNDVSSLTFVGHSLGGALAQYAAYDFVKEGIVTTAQTTITTFNGLGGVSGLEKKYGGEYQSTLLNGADIHHYFDPSDMVSMLSKHVGGSSTNYQLRADDTPVFTGTAHTMGMIESYMRNGTLELSLQRTHDYFDLNDAVPILQTFGDFTNGWIYGGEFDANSVESVARLLSMISFIPLLEAYPAGAQEWDALKEWLLTNVAKTVFHLDGTAAVLAVVAMDEALDSIGKLLLKEQPEIQAGLAVTSFLAEAYDWFTDDDSPDPATKALVYDLINNLVGTSPYTDSQGNTWDELVTEEMVERMLDSASNNEQSTYSTFLGHLGTMLGRPSTGSLLDTIELHNFISENPIRANYVLPVTDLTKDELINWASADTKFGLLGRYALVELSSFLLVVDEDNSSIASAVLNNERYSLEKFSEQYISDRAHFLLQILDRNLNDSTAVTRGVASGEHSKEYYLDYGTDTFAMTSDVSAYSEGRPAVPDGVKAYIFGDENSNLDITGGDQADRLYGGAGTDVIKGAEGNDYIEGNQGNDILYGGEGADEIHGGDGKDFLHSNGQSNATDGAVDTVYGDKGDDKFFLNSGDLAYDSEGTDTYYVATEAGGGRVIIDDSDQKGSLVINGQVIQNAFYESENQWSDLTYTLELSGSSLLISGPDGTDVELKNFTNGDFGIHLESASEEEPEIVTDNVIQGDQESDPDDVIYDTAANDTILAGDGDDVVYRRDGGDDIIELGDGDDNLLSPTDVSGRIIAKGGAGRDALEVSAEGGVLEGGVDADEQGDAADFILLGADEPGSGLQGEWFDAEGGNDQIFGGAGNDLAAGGEGDDLIVTGGGSDWIWGDLNTHSSGDEWKQWSVIEEFDGTQYTYHLENIYTQNDEGVGNDVIYAGAGNDVAFSEKGNDTLFLESGDDKGWGQEGDDVLLGEGPIPHGATESRFWTVLV